MGQALAKHPYGLLRKNIASQLKINTGGLFSNHLNDLTSAGFISKIAPVQKSGKSNGVKYFLTDAYLRFYLNFIEPASDKIFAGLQKGHFSQLTQQGSYSAFKGRGFEYLCFQHAHSIASILGFSGIDYSFGPFYLPGSAHKKGIQIDLLFSRSDNTLTLCEMKFTRVSPGVNIIPEVETKIEILRNNFPDKTIQCVLITLAPPTKELENSLYFYTIIEAQQLIEC